MMKEVPQMLPFILFCLLTLQTINARAYILPISNHSDNELPPPTERFTSSFQPSRNGQIVANQVSITNKEQVTDEGKETLALLASEKLAQRSSGGTGNLNRIRKSLRSVGSFVAAEKYQHPQGHPVPSNAILTPMVITQRSEDDIFRLLSLITPEVVPTFVAGNPVSPNLPPAVPIVAPRVSKEYENDDDDGAIELGYYGSDLGFSPPIEGASRKKPAASSRPQHFAIHENDEDNGWIDIYSHRVARRSGRELSLSDKISSQPVKLHLQRLYPTESNVITVDNNDDRRERGAERGQKFNMHTLGQLLSPSQTFQDDLPFIHRGVL